MAIGTLSITSEEFYDLSPVEFYYALKSVGDFRRARSRELYEIARLQAILIVNPTLPEKYRFKKVTDLHRFPWDADDDRKQTPEEMRQELFKIAGYYSRNKLKDPSKQQK